jgi:hypothetical protein
VNYFQCEKIQEEYEQDGKHEKEKFKTKETGKGNAINKIGELCYLAMFNNVI